MLAGIVSVLIVIAVVLMWRKLPRGWKWGVGIVVGVPFAALMLLALTPIFD